MTTRIQKYLYRFTAVAFAAFVFAGFVPNSSAQVNLGEPEWKIFAGENAWFQDAGNRVRGIAFNPVTNHLLVASRDGETNVTILDAADGSFVGNLDVTGVEGGTYGFALSRITITDDGQIFVANFKDANRDDFPTEVVRIYYYADETAAPMVVYSGIPNQKRYGDSFNSAGTGDAVTLYLSGTFSDQIAVFSFDGDAAAFDRFISVPANAANGSIVDNGDGTAWINGRDQEIRKIDLESGEILNAIPSSVVATGNGELVSFELNDKQFLGTGVMTDSIFTIINITNENTPVVVAKAYASGFGANDFRVANVAVDPVNNRFFGLSTNVALAAFNYTPAGDVDFATVTFRVNTATVPDTLRGSDDVFMRGAFRPGADGDWQEGTYFGQEISWGTTLPMTSVGGDYWERELVMGKGDQIQWKYFPKFADGTDTDSPDDGWEADPTRTFTVPVDAEGPIVLDLDYWNRGIPFVAEQDSLTMFFRVNVGNDVALGRFDPGNAAHRVGVRGVPEVFGNPADWGSTAFYLDAEPVRPGSANYFYSGALRLPKAALPEVTGEFPYKFVVEGTSVQWDDNAGFPDGNRFAPLSAADSTLRWVFFQNSAPPTGEIVSASLQFAVKVGVLEGLGYFNRGLGDDVTIPGGFNGWDTGTAASYNSALDVWTAAFDINEVVGSNVAYKYYVRWDESRFDSESPNYIPRLTANNGWEEPGLTGGSDRLYTFTNETIQQVDDFGSGVSFFNGVPVQGVIGETISGNDVLSTRFVVDMTAALTHEDPFDPDNDALYVIFETPFFGLSQGLTVGDNLAILEEGNEDEAARVRMSPVGENNLWELDLDVLLPTENHMGFVIAYVKPDGEIISNGGGFGPGRRYYRYITPLDVADPNDILWPDSDELDLIVWRPGEDLDFPVPPSYGLTSNIGENIREVVNTYALYQNYPNPFNPTTNISYTVPQSSDVRIDVYNVLGQRVATLVNARMNAGTHSVQFDARSFASGMYLYRIQAGDFVSTRQMMLIK
ncbi:MAG: T9SS type A sorting domain-containing protein [Cyclonatronaceae bacterium]